MKNSANRIVNKVILYFGLWLCLVSLNGLAQQSMDSDSPPRIVEFIGNQPMTRVGRPFEVLGVISNPAKIAINLTATLKLPEGIHLEGMTVRSVKLSPDEKVTLRWNLFSDKPQYTEILLEVSNKLDILAASRLPVRFLPKMEKLTAWAAPKINKH